MRANPGALVKKDYSVWSLFKQGLKHNEGWDPAWRSPEPKSSYNVVIVGAGGHGLATAYYLAKEHGIRGIAVIEKGFLGGGNTARNTTIVRSNYLWDEAALLYEHSLKLWEGLTQDLNFNVMFSQRGVFNLGHTIQDMRDIERRVNANNLNGIDAVAWGFARAASKYGVDIIENCEVTGMDIAGGRIKGLQTARGFIGADQVGCVAAGHSSVMAKMAGIRMPIESHPLQAFVSESLKPVLDTVVMSNAVHGYLSQSDKGELVIGAGIDHYNSYAQRGSPHVIEHTAAAIIEMFPMFSRVRMNRQWGGIVDTTPDACPIISKTNVKGLYFNCGWGTGGFKATPGSGNVFAHTIAHDAPHPLNKAFDIGRFSTGHLIDEHGAAGVAH
jgi:sarcosine oxidase, subunit beta